MDWEQRHIHNPVKHLRWNIFDGWYCPEYASGWWKYTKRKIVKFSRTFQSVILKTASKYQKSIYFLKDYRKKFYRKFANFSQRITFCFMLSPKDQNSSSFLHLCINSITIYSKPTAEITIQRCSFKHCFQIQRCFVEQLFSFSLVKFTRNHLFQNLFFINFASCRPVTLLKRLR